MQIFLVTFLVTALGLGLYKAYASGFENAELQNRVKASEVMREAYVAQSERAAEERTGKEAAEERAQTERQRGETLALAAQEKWQGRAEAAQRAADEANAALETERAKAPPECPPIPEVQPQCPDICYSLDWQNR